MKKIILTIGMILIMGTLLCILTGCKENQEENIKDTNDMTESNMNNVGNNIEDTNNHQENTIKNETNTSNNIQASNSKEDKNTSKNDNEQTEEKNETTASTPKKTTFNVGKYTLHYGKYKGSGTKLIDTNIISATITINLKEDGTYTYTSTNPKVSEDRSGTYEIKNNNVIVLNADEPLEYTVMGNDYLIERQSSGFTFHYQEN